MAQLRHVVDGHRPASAFLPSHLLSPNSPSGRTRYSVQVDSANFLSHSGSIFLRRQIEMRSPHPCISPFRVKTPLLLGLVACLMVGTASAATSETLTLTLLVVDETVACRPDGYQEYANLEQPSRVCEPITAEDVTRWLEDSVLSEKMDIPPQRIRLGRLVPFLNTYINIDLSEVAPTSRKSAVFLFDWKVPQSFDLRFRRVSNSSIVPTSAWSEFRMRGHQRWIHHERADSLAPSRQIEWILITDDGEFTLRTSER